MARVEASSLPSVEKAELVHCVWNVVLAKVRLHDGTDEAERSDLLAALTRECYTADGALMAVLLPLVVCLQGHFFQRCVSDRLLSPSCDDDMLSAFVEALFVSYRDVRLNSSLRRLYYSILTNPFFFRQEAFHQPSHAYHQFLLFIVQEVTSNAGSDGLFFVTLFTAALRQVPTAIANYTHELASLSIMTESRDEVAVARPSVEEYVRVVVLHFFDALGDQATSALQAIMTELLQLNLAVLSAGRHIQNSEGNGVRLRCWQALCVLARRADVGANSAIHDLFWKCVVQLNLRDVRHYIDLVGVELIRSCVYG